MRSTTLILDKDRNKHKTYKEEDYKGVLKKGPELIKGVYVVMSNCWSSVGRLEKKTRRGTTSRVGSDRLNCRGMSFKREVEWHVEGDGDVLERLQQGGTWRRSFKISESSDPVRTLSGGTRVVEVYNSKIVSNKEVTDYRFQDFY